MSLNTSYGTGQACVYERKKGKVHLDLALQRSLEPERDLLLVPLPSVTGKTHQAAAEEKDGAGFRY